MRPWILALLLVVALALLAGSAEAHRQGLRAGYTRLAYDCSHDWGWESGQPDDMGHELVTLDVIETNIEGRALMVFELNFVQAAGLLGQRPTYGMKETLSITGSRGSFTTTFVSSTENELVYESGLRPSYIGPRKAGLSGTGWDATTPDEALLAFDVGYTYAQLKLQNGDRLTDYTIVASYQAPDGRWRQGDILPGGTTSPTGAHEPACKKGRHAPEADETYYRAPYFQVERSDWTPPRPTTPTPTPTPSPTPMTPTPPTPAPNAPPVAEFNWTPLAPLVGENVTLTDRSHDADGTIAQRAWIVGGVAVGNATTLTTSFTAAGTHVIVLVVTDDQGANMTRWANVTVAARPETPVPETPATPTRPPPTPEPVTPARAEESPSNETPPASVEPDPDPVRERRPPTAPVLDVRVDGSNAAIGRAIPLQAQVYDPDGLVVRLQWRIGDKVHPGAVATFVPERAGSHAVTIEAWDARGPIAHATKHIDVAAPPLEARVDATHDDAGIHLQANVTGEAVAWEWFLPDGSVSRAQSVRLPASAEGGRVGLVVTDRDGQVASTTIDLPRSAVRSEHASDVPLPGVLALVGLGAAALRRRIG